MANLWNEEIKERFLKEYYENESTQKTIRNVFFNSYAEEYRLDRDLYTFDEVEIAEIIRNSNPHSKQTAKSSGRFIKQYLDWAADKGYRKSNLNPMEALTDAYYEKLYDHSKKIHYSYDEFIELLEELHNGQDQAFLVLIFNGIIGRSFSDLQHLTFNDIDFDNNTVYVKSRDKHIKIYDGLMKYLDKAYKENTYFTYNPETKELNESELLSSPFVFKNLKSPRSREGVSVNPSVFYTRLNGIRSEWEMEYMTPNSIKQSGMQYQSILLFKEHGVLRYDQFAEIGEKYQFNKLKSGESEYYNTNLMKEFINEDKLKELYDIDVIIENR